MRAGFFLALLAATSAAWSQGPTYKLDLAWPKPLPERWVIGGLGGVCVDNQDHVFILNRQDLLDADLNSGSRAPLIIEFDAAGNTVNAWGNPDLLDDRLHACHADGDNNIWIGSSPSGMVQKYSHDGGKLLLQIGKKGVLDSSDGSAKGKPLNSDAAKFFMPASMVVDRQNGDVYVADGENPGGNLRIAVMDKHGKFLRQWRPEGMASLHCMEMSNDGLVYVGNRQNSRIQVYDKRGGFVKNIETPWKPYTAPPDGKPVETGGSASAIALSRDPKQTLLYVINQNNSQVEILERQTGKALSKFGRAGHFPGEFDQPHGIAVDSRGNVYIAENRGKRVQKFTPTNVK